MDDILNSSLENKCNIWNLKVADLHMREINYEERLSQDLA
jgi:hypothetical protein